MFSLRADNDAQLSVRTTSSMTGFEHLLKSYNVGDAVDDIASADPPSYLRRCFAEASSASELSRARIEQLAVCAMVLDSILNDRDYGSLEPELIADWRAHDRAACARLKDGAVAALKRAHDALAGEPDAAAEIEILEQRLAQS
jgi:hypothetical protein